MNHIVQNITTYFTQVPNSVDIKDYRFHIIGKVANVIGGLVHFSWIFIFTILNVPILALFNVFSVCIYLLALYHAEKNRYLTSAAMGVVEIILHQLLVSRLLGLNGGFQYYLIMIAIFPFLMPKGKTWIKVLLSSSCFFCFIIVDFFIRKTIPYYTLSEETLMIFKLFNILACFTFLCMWGAYFNFAVVKTQEALDQEYQKSERLLLNILPTIIANRLKTEPTQIADRFANVTVLFADIVGFTILAEQKTPEELVTMLNSIFSMIDDLVEKYDVEKIKTIGDAYMVAAGIPEPRPDHAEIMANFALEMMEQVHQYNIKENQHFQIRVGLHSGPVVAGVIGKKKFSYDLWGDTVNIASRMESHSMPNQIQVSSVTYELLKEKYNLESRGKVQVKGKGMTATYFLKKMLGQKVSNP